MIELFVKSLLAIVVIVTTVVIVDYALDLYEWINNRD